MNQTREEEAEEKKEDCADRRQPSEDSGHQSSRTCNPATKKTTSKTQPMDQGLYKTLNSTTESKSS